MSGYCHRKYGWDDSEYSLRCYMGNYNQIPLPLVCKSSFDEEGFILGDCNRYAFDWIEKWPSRIPDERFVCIVGEKGAGKTHLANIWAQRNQGSFIENKCDAAGVLLDLYEASSTKYFIMDEADELFDDVFLFYVYNSIVENNAYLLMTAKVPPSKWQVSLSDMKSRVSTIHSINIKTPDEDTLANILKRELKQKGIVIENNISNYILSNIERSYSAISTVVERINKMKMKPILKNIKNLITNEQII